jgi:2,3-bisphosphoglycerate-independent phosphoglycerate mutase
MNNKFAIIVGDGMADLPIAELGNKTPLEYAVTPNMDFLAQSGHVGIVSTVPEGFPPGSDVANLSLLGYDPALYYSGRAPVEAASLGIELAAEDTAFRCNLVTIIDGIMVDYSAGHINTAEATVLISQLQKELGSHEIQFHPGTSYRHILVIKNFPDGLICTPPHDITDQTVKSYLPQGYGETQIHELMSKAHQFFQKDGSPKDGESNNKSRATDIWLWGQVKLLNSPK